MTSTHESPLPPRTADARRFPCLCVKRHVPKVHRTHEHHVHPLGMGGEDTDDNKVHLCPTTHSEVHLIIEDFTRRRGLRTIRPEESVYAYALARQGYVLAHPDTPLPGREGKPNKPNKKARGGFHGARVS